MGRLCRACYRRRRSRGTVLRPHGRRRRSRRPASGPCPRACPTLPGGDAPSSAARSTASSATSAAARCPARWCRSSARPWRWRSPTCTGRFSLDTLPAGEYTLRAHLAGFAASRREHVPSVGAPRRRYRLQLRRLDAAGRAPPGARPTRCRRRPIIAAGFGLPHGRIRRRRPPPAKDDHPHTETAWRLRHIPRSILKDSVDHGGARRRR